jgi:TolB-like protein
MSEGFEPPPSSPSVRDRRSFAFGDFRLDVGERTLAGPDGAEANLTGRPLALLVFMLERPGRLLTKDELLSAVWPEVTVEENSLSQAVSALRRALGGRDYIETVSGVGYRFTAPVTPAEPAPHQADRPSIAVLPFEDLSPAGDQGYFADGVAEEILNRLAEIPGVRVIGRASSFALKGRADTARAAGEALGASHLLTGAVRKDGARLRVTAQLIEVGAGVQAWSERFDREPGDIFAVQDEIAGAVASAVLFGMVEVRRAAGGTSNLEAHDLYLRARATMHEMGAPSTAKAIKLYREAVALDPGFALAWSGLVEASRGAVIFTPAHATEARRTITEAARCAVAAAPDHWASQIAEALRLVLEHDWGGAERAHAHAEACAPSAPSDLLFARATFLAQVGRVGSAIEAMRRVVRDDPLSLLASNLLHLDLYTAGREADAEVEYRRGLNLRGARDVPEHTALQRAWIGGDKALIAERFARYLAHQTVPVPALRRVYEVRDEPERALVILRSAVGEPQAQAAAPQMILAWWLAHYGDLDAALAAATQAQLAHGAPTSWLWFPCFAPVRRLPGFNDLLVQLRLPEYWRTTGEWGDFARPAGARARDFECL